MQKFVQRCLVRIFQNERSRSTPLDPKLMLWCVSFRLGAFGTVSLLHKTCCKTRQTGAINAKFRPRCLVRIFGNEHSQSTLLDPKLMFWCVSFHSDVFWTVSLLHETWCKSAKLVQLMQKFMLLCRARIFCNERSRSTPLDPKLMFGCVSLRSGAFWNSFATAQNLVLNAPNWCN